MSYAAFGLDIQANFVAAAAEAKTQSRSVAVDRGVPAVVFDAFDDIAVRGADPQTVLRTRGIDTARSLLSQNAAQFSKTTGVPAAAIDALLEGLQSGDIKKTALDSAAIIGGALGTAACGPACGMVVSMVATGLVQAVDNVAHVWILGDWDRDRRAENERMYRQNIQAIQETSKIVKQYNKLELGIVYAAELGPARTYNDLLGLKVTIQVEQVVAAVMQWWVFVNLPQSAPPWSKDLTPYKGLLYDGGYTPDMAKRADAANKVASQENSIVYATLGNISRQSFADQNGGLRVEDTVLLEVRKAFVDAVKKAVDAKYPGLWDRNKTESMFYERLEKWVVSENSGQGFPGGGTNPSLVPAAENRANLFCSWSDADLNQIAGATDAKGGEYRCDRIYGDAARPANLADWQWSTPGYIPPAFADNRYGTPCWPNFCGPSNPRDPCFGGPALLRAWRCHLPRHYDYIATNAGDLAQRWLKVATRDISILTISDQMRKAAQDATKAASLAAATALMQQKPATTVAAVATVAAEKTISAQVSAWGKMRDAFTGKSLSPTQKALAISGVGLLGAAAVFLFAPAPAAKSA
jgi:hypothetical protein